jgi:hypothetical protein
MDLREGMQTTPVVEFISTMPLTIEKLTKWRMLKVVYWLGTWVAVSSW